MKSDEILIKTFNQVKNDNFDQVKFDQVIVCLLECQIYVSPLIIQWLKQVLIRVTVEHTVYGSVSKSFLAWEQ